MAWSVVYEVDFRDAFTALGETDLDFVGSSFTFQGIEWKTPSVARGNPFDQGSSAIWRLQAGGLRCDSPAFLGFSAANNSTPHVYASLEELAANTETPFDGDPTRKYMWQCYVSAITGVSTADRSGAGCGIYKIDRGVTLGNATLTACCVGGDPLRNLFQAGKSIAPLSTVRADIARSVPIVMYRGSGSYVDGYAGSWTGDWPAFDAVALVGSYRDSATDNDNDMVADPPFFRFAVYHHDPTLGSVYDATIERVRLLQR